MAQNRSRMPGMVTLNIRLNFCWLLLCLVWIRHGFCAESNDQHSTNTTVGTNNSSRPIIHVFFEPITPEQRFTSMSDDDNDALLNFWRLTWTAAGWQPKVLTLQDAKRHVLYDSFQQQLDELCIDEFGKLSLLKWLAMAAVGGGWLADYDAFPLQRHHDSRRDDMPHNGEMTIYEAVAPILASGLQDAWLDTAKYLLKHAKNCKTQTTSGLSFWTDTLGVLSAWRDDNITCHVEKQVLDGRKALREEPLTVQDCNKRPFRGKRVVHFGHFAMLEGASVAPELRLPRYRVTIAKEWLPKWMAVCGSARNDTKVS